MSKIQAVLYRRFSHGAQAKGYSLKRQSKLAEEWCEKNDAEIIDVHTDAGVSGFHGKHAAVGALSAVLESIKSGDIPEGAYLLVENLDRLGRDEVDIALNRFSSILRSGIKIVSLMDGKIFNRESVSNISDLMWAIITMARANEESTTKSRRTAETWQKRMRDIRAGLRPNMKSPKWFDYDKSKQCYVLNDKASSIAAAFKVFNTEKTLGATARKLNALGVPTASGINLWNMRTVKDVLKSKASYGTLVKNGEEFENFFPAAVSKETYLLAKAERERRTIKNGTRKKNKVANLLISIAKCECGEAMHMQTQRELRKRTGLIADYSSLRCSTARSKDSDECNKRFRYSHLEHALVFVLSEVSEMPLSKTAKTKLTELLDEQALLESELKEIREKTKNLTEMLSVSPSVTMAKLITELEDKSVVIESKLNDVEVEIAELKVDSDNGKVEEKIKRLFKNITDDDYRHKIVYMLNRCISKCVFYHEGIIKLVIHGREVAIKLDKKMSQIKFTNKTVTLHHQ